MSDPSQDGGPSVPIHNWMRVILMTILMLISLFLDVRDYGEYLVGALGVTESIVIIHGFMAGLPIGNSITGNLVDTPENWNMRLANFFMAVAIFVVCVWMTITITLN